jgi:uncharacterized protein YgiM (DUF1202 family)
MIKTLKLRKAAISIALTSASIALLASSAWAQPTTTPGYGKTTLQDKTVCSFITGNNVNVRSGPGNHYKVITKLNRGDGVRATYRKGNWVAISARVYGYSPNETYKPLKGWVSNFYINGCSEDQFERWR